MSDRTDRSGARDARRGLQSVVQLYLSRPPRRAFAWPEPEVGGAPGETPAEERPARRALEAEPRPAIESSGFAPDAPGFVPDESAVLGPISEPARDHDAVARGIQERFDARIEAVTAIPFVDWDAEDEGAAAVGEEAVEDLEITERAELEPFETAPEPVLSGISLDIEDLESRDAFSEDDLPAQEIGSEALRAELAFKLEEHLEAGHDPLDGPRFERGDDPVAEPAVEPPDDLRVDSRHETEIFFEEDAHEPMTDVLPATTTVEEIFDLVERSLSLGPAYGVETAASLGRVEEVAWEILPEEVPEAETAAAQAAQPGPAPTGDGPPDLVVGRTHSPVAELAPIDIAGEVVEPAASLHAPRIALFLSTLPPRLRRRLLDRLAAPLATGGRNVLFVEPDPPDGDEGVLIEEARGAGTAVWRRTLGASPREILLMRPAQRERLFAVLAEEERRSELVLFGVGLPESIVCPRMLPLVDTIVVGLTRQESSLYEAYRALRGLPERRPGLTPYAVTVASSAEEAALLLERFRQIAKDFLRIPVLDGGWLELASLPHQPAPGEADAAAEGEPRDPSKPGIAPELKALMTAPREDTSDAGRPGPVDRAHDGRPERPFFERLADWFGPAFPRQ